MTLTGPGLVGHVRRVNGPVVEAVGLGGVSVFDVVAVGANGLAGEVVSLAEDAAIIQVYEYAGGVAPGDLVHSQGEPLSVDLGPGLLGEVFDGVLRPLGTAGAWLRPSGASAEAPGPHQAGPTWHFLPNAPLHGTVRPGQCLGTVTERGRFQHRILVPPAVGGALGWLAPEADYRTSAVVARVGGTELRLHQRWPVRRPRPVRGRRRGSRILHTGQRAVDLLYPVTRGGTAAVPGGFGTGKTLLLQQIAKWCDADVIVYVGCGERGNELIDVLQDLARIEDPRSGGTLRDRTVTIANTSNMPVMAREASIYTGIAVAEYFRDMGLDVVVIADSTSRWAEALREFASRTDQVPAEEGYPANLASSLAAFYERAGDFATLSGRQGSVTVIGAVSPPGGDLTEPVTSHTRRMVRSFWSLDRDLAYARHYPALSWDDSFSRDAESLGPAIAPVGHPQWEEQRTAALTLLAEADRLESLAALVGTAAIPARQRMVLRTARLLREAVLDQDATSPRDAFCAPGKQRALLGLVLEVGKTLQDLVAAGVAPDTLELLDLELVARAKESGGPNNVTAVRRIAGEARARLSAVR